MQIDWWADRGVKARAHYMGSLGKHADKIYATCKLTRFLKPEQREHFILTAENCQRAEQRQRQYGIRSSFAYEKWKMKIQ